MGDFADYYIEDFIEIINYGATLMKIMNKIMKVNTYVKNIRIRV